MRPWRDRDKVCETFGRKMGSKIDSDLLWKSNERRTRGWALSIFLVTRNGAIAFSLCWRFHLQRLRPVKFSFDRQLINFFCFKPPCSSDRRKSPFNSFHSRQKILFCFSLDNRNEFLCKYYRNGLLVFYRVIIVVALVIIPNG